MNEIVNILIEHGAEFSILDPTLRAAGGAGVALAKDWIGPERLDNLRNILNRYSEKLKRRKVNPIRPPLSVLLPLLEAAQDESREELREIWAALLAAAADPARSHLFRRDFIDVAKRLEPVDALVLSAMSEGNIWGPEWVGKTSLAIKLTPQQVEVAGRNLESVGLLQTPPTTRALVESALVSATGKQFLACIAD